MATRKIRIVALTALFTLISTSNSLAATTSKLNVSQCKKVISSFQGLYDPAGGLKVSGPIQDSNSGSSLGMATPPISKITKSRNVWKSIEPTLTNGTLKFELQSLIEEAYKIITTGTANGNEGRVSLLWNKAIVDLTKSCLPKESNQFCLSIQGALESVSSLLEGKSLAKSGITSTRKIWSEEVKKWPSQSYSRAWMNQLLTYLDEIITEAKAGRSITVAATLFYEEWNKTDQTGNLLDYWPCIDRVAEALGHSYSG